MTESKRIELEALLVKRTVEGLAPAENERVEALLGELPDADPDALDRAAAAILLGSLGTAVEPMPERLRAKLETTVARGSPKQG